MGRLFSRLASGDTKQFGIPDESRTTEVSQLGVLPSRSMEVRSTERLCAAAVVPVSTFQQMHFCEVSEDCSFTSRHRFIPTRHTTHSTYTVTSDAAEVSFYLIDRWTLGPP